VAVNGLPRPASLTRGLLFATALLASLVLAAQAGAAAPRSFYGVVSANDPTATEIARMGAGRVGTLRVNFAWGAVQPTEGAAYNWSHYDNVIGEAARNGIRPLLTVYSSPAWAARHDNLQPAPDHIDEFRDFVSAAVARYGNGGTFWTTHPTIPALPVIWWQLWNESNSPSFWYPKPNPRQYVALLRVFHDAVVGSDPGAKIALAGLFLTPRVKHGIFLDRYLGAIYRLKAKGLFDAAAVHPYEVTPRRVLDSVRIARRVMNRFHDRRSSLWITEIGWASGGNRTPLTVSPARQARYLRTLYKLLAANRGRMHIPGVVWYSFRDVPGGIWFNHTGLFTEGFDPKPAWSAYTGLTGGTP
jgi:polysaccharide biosynthesis protein PslG